MKQGCDVESHETGNRNTGVKQTWIDLLGCAGAGWTVEQEEDVAPVSVFMCDHKCSSRIMLDKVPDLYEEMGVTVVSCDACGKETMPFYHCTSCKSYDTCADCFESELARLQ